MARPISLIVPLLILILVSVGSAQTDPVGAVDSVVVTSVQAATGSGFVMTVRLVNDEPLSAWSVPLRYDRELMTLDSVGFANTLSGDWTFLQMSHDAGTGALLIGAVVLSEDLIPPGGGDLAHLYFQAAGGREAGEVGLVDTAFVPPAGEFLLTAQPHANIYPAYEAGKLTIVGGDQPPVFTSLSGRTLREGDKLTLAVAATDPEGAPVTLAAAKLPAGAMFTDNDDGSGLFEFTPPYAGPGSAARGPYTVVFSASDGIAVATMPVKLDVININRAPVFEEAAAVSAGAGDTIEIAVVANDPDFEPVRFEAEGLPAGASLEADNPAMLRWQSAVADSGLHQFSVTAHDASGASSVQQYAIDLAATIPAVFTLSEEQAENGHTVEVTLSLHNRVEIASMLMLIRFDPTLISLEDIITENTRVAAWDRVGNSLENNEGLIWLDAECDTMGGNANALATGDGDIVRLRFRVSPDYGLAGYYSQVRFEFIDSDSLSENYVHQTDGVLITSTQLEYNSGGVLITAYDGLIGDLNLNDVAFEVADYVYFQNYFTNPAHYPLDGERWPNSDINQNGTPGELADLAYMEEIRSSGGPKLAETETELSGTYSLLAAASGYSYRVDYAGEAAGLYCKFAISENAEIELALSGLGERFQVLTGQDRDTLRLLLLRPQGRQGGLPVSGELFAISGATEVELVAQSLVDSRCREVVLKYDSRAATLPDGFSLTQNHPNPFNPETTIDFALPQDAEVTLVVYNVLGKKVRELVSGWLPAGEHQIRFDGREDSGAELASGVYFYRLRAGTFEDTRKMVLLK
ncbi:MAG: FlgD immunoglobulin-like domain containing protein [bacterium]